jgi:hypothetical protein
LSFTDLAAVVGALAWLPPMFVVFRNWVTKPQIRIFTQPSPEIGFTSFGPILNLRVALTVTHKDIVITGIRLKVTHESNEQIFFSWRGVVQRMGTINYPQLGAVPFEKELNVLAMKVSLKDVEERSIRFQNVDFLQEKSELEAVTLKTMAHLRKTDSFDERGFLKSQEMADLFSFIRQSFSWKPGGYRLQVLIESPDSFSVLDDEYTFNLSPLQVQNLSDNLQYIERYYVDEVMPQEEGKQISPIPWRWVYPEMPKVSG